MAATCQRERSEHFTRRRRQCRALGFNSEKDRGQRDLFLMLD